MLGYAFMGKAHSNAFKTLDYIYTPPPRIRGSSPSADATQAGGRRRARYGYEQGVTDWHDIVEDPSIRLFDNCGPNSLHFEPTMPPIQAGKHVLCEKPLGMTADERTRCGRRAATGVVHMCGFNYRFVPAIRLMRQIIEAGGSARSTTSARATCRTGATTRRSTRGGSIRTRRAPARSATSARTSSIWRASSSASRSAPSPRSTTFLPGRKVDDAFDATVTFENGAIGTLEATRFARGRRNAFQWEINGAKGSLAFDMERLNELQVFRADGDRARGFKTVLVSEADHPFWASGGRRATSSAGATRSSTRSTTCSARSRTTGDVAPTARRSRTATARPRSATRSSARARAGRATASSYRSL